MSDKTRPQHTADAASSPDELVKDLEIRVSEEDAVKVTGGKEQKADGSLGGSVKLGYDFGKMLKA